MPAQSSEKTSAFASMISAAGRSELYRLVEENLARFSDREVLQVLRHPFCGEPVIEEILASRRALSTASVRKAIALHPAAPRAQALRCLEDLAWRDLLDISREARTPMPVRLRASQWLIDKLPRLTLGEKTALARLADRPVIPVLLRDPDPRVFGAVLLNPRLVEEDLVAWVTTGRPLPASLGVLSSSEKWMMRSAVRLAMVECRAAPRSLALSLLSRCSAGDLQRVVENPASDRLLVACAERLISERPIDEHSEIF